MVPMNLQARETGWKIDSSTDADTVIFYEGTKAFTATYLCIQLKPDAAGSVTIRRIDGDDDRVLEYHDDSGAITLYPGDRLEGNAKNSDGFVFDKTEATDALLYYASNNIEPECFSIVRADPPGTVEESLCSATTLSAGDSLMVTTDMGGYRELAFKIVADSCDTESFLYLYSSATGSTTLTTGDPALFDMDPSDSVIDPFLIPVVDRDNLGLDDFGTLSPPLVMIYARDNYGSAIIGSHVVGKIKAVGNIWQCEVIAVKRK